MSWSRLLAHWGLVEADLHERYGVDVDSDILDTRSWRWLRVRILALLSTDSRVARIMQRPKG